MGGLFVPAGNVAKPEQLCSTRLITFPFCAESGRKGMAHEEMTEND